jgi:hypothetical protein
MLPSRLSALPAACAAVPAFQPVCVLAYPICLLIRHLGCLCTSHTQQYTLPCASSARSHASATSVSGQLEGPCTDTNTDVKTIDDDAEPVSSSSLLRTEVSYRGKVLAQQSGVPRGLCSQPIAPRPSARGRCKMAGGIATKNQQNKTNCYSVGVYAVGAVPSGWHPAMGVYKAIN